MSGLLTAEDHDVTYNQPFTPWETGSINIDWTISG
jgi:hypothetical protein